MRPTVLRLGHRPGRDQRTTTHVALTARAFGCRAMVLPVDDPDVRASVADVADRFGGDFAVEVRRDWRALIRDWDGPVVHLTMYGRPVGEAVDAVPREGEPLLVVGAAKVPGEVYGMVDHNVAVGNQPHSEVAALAVLLDRLLGPDALMHDFGGRLKVVPQARGKKVVEGGGAGRGDVERAPAADANGGDA